MHHYSSDMRCLLDVGVIEVLTEGLKDKNERVRRRIMATLGELLFYVATQQQVSCCFTKVRLCITDCFALTNTAGIVKPASCLQRRSSATTTVLLARL